MIILDADEQICGLELHYDESYVFGLGVKVARSYYQVSEESVNLVRK